jgi:hypothetical protein
MTVFVTDVDVFADARGDRQRAVEESLLQSCLYALRRYGQRGWLDALVARAEQVIRDEIQSQTDRSPSAEGRAEIASWRVFTRRALAQTSEPDPSTILSQAQTIAAMLSTSVLNTAAVAIGREQDEPMLKTWITVKDERVRASHAAVHGQSVPLGEKFTVGGVPMDRPGDLSAPPEETLNCRCLVGLTAESDALAASGEERTSALVVFLPASDDPVNEASSEDQAHVTTVWFGEADLPWPLINEAVAAAAAAMKPFTVAVKSRGLLGDKDADVLFLDADDLAEQRQALLDVPVIKDGMDSVEQYPQWTPHLTLGYPDSPATLAEEPEAITVDRLALWVGKERTTYPLGADMADDDFEPTPTDDLIDVVEAVPFWGVLAPEGTPSGDRRQFGAGSLRSRPLPLPLSYQRVNMDGHDGSVRVGTIERAWRKGSLVLGAGHLLTSIPEVDEVISVMAESGGRMGVSVDADDVEVEMTAPDGSAIDDPELAVEIMTSVPTARIAGATLCHIPAFHEAFIALGDVPDEYAPAEGEDLAIESRAQRSVAAAVKTEDGPGWLTHPADTDRLRDYWTHGKGAAKIGWGTPGDFNRCRANLAKYVKPMYLSGYCANRHYDALGFWPGDHARKHSLGVTASGEPDGPFITLVADATERPNGDWFTDPLLTGPSPIVVTEDGRIFCHLATWGTCHIGISDVCITPPSSPTDYSFFRTGTVLTTTGEVPVGQITMGTGHANLQLNASRTVAHYDNTGTVVADVAAGEDEYGIWISGAVRASATPEQIAALRGSALSGDWRTIRGHLELVAALAVNVPGFPIPRIGLAASGGKQSALVAAGIAIPGLSETPIDLNTIVDGVLSAIGRREQMAAMMRESGRDPKSKMAALAAARKD